MVKPRQVRSALAAALACGLLAVGCSSTAPSSTSAPSTPHVIVIVEENHSYQQIMDSGIAERITGMAAAGTLLTSYYAVTHPSLPNYLDLLSGDSHGITSDCAGCHVSAPSLPQQLDAAGISWRAYMQGLPAPCSQVTTAGHYARRHDPFMYFDGVRTNPRLCRNIVPLDQFYSDLASGQLPEFSWITPDLAHDMHGAEGPVLPGSPQDAVLVRQADTWLGDLYDRLTTSGAWTQDTRLVITWDEGLRSEHGQQESCCGGLAAGGHIATIVVGPQVPSGTDATSYSHYSLLRSIETLFGLPHLGHAADPAVRDIPVLAQR